MARASFSTFSRGDLMSKGDLYAKELQSNLTPEEVEKLASEILVDDEDEIVD